MTIGWSSPKDQVQVRFLQGTFSKRGQQLSLFSHCPRFIFLFLFSSYKNNYTYHRNTSNAKITYDFEYLKIHISLQPDLTFKSSSNLWLSQNLFLRNTNIELQFIDIQFHLIKPFSGQCILPLSDRQNLSHN